ncbi:hypothetical protein EVAR_52855_1 [Eumeta japonica]|uniref:Uncharacterized protein n=1 Tax=Eumeta variegata TaxID=151549 RepID=A0A4C1YF86_EUMVA|nr:hypothetical protein EVAR_52855_1 [Eumeta japonica]
MHSLCASESTLSCQSRPSPSSGDDGRPQPPTRAGLTKVRLEDMMGGICVVNNERTGGESKKVSDSFLRPPDQSGNRPLAAVLAGLPTSQLFCVAIVSI